MTIPPARVVHRVFMDWSDSFSFPVLLVLGDTEGALHRFQLDRDALQAIIDLGTQAQQVMGTSPVDGPSD